MSSRQQSRWWSWLVVVIGKVGAHVCGKVFLLLQNHHIQQYTFDCQINFHLPRCQARRRALQCLRSARCTRTHAAKLERIKRQGGVDSKRTLTREAGSSVGGALLPPLGTAGQQRGQGGPDIPQGPPQPARTPQASLFQQPPRVATHQAPGHPPGRLLIRAALRVLLAPCVCIRCQNFSVPLLLTIVHNHLSAPWRCPRSTAGSPHLHSMLECRCAFSTSVQSLVSASWCCPRSTAGSPCLHSLLIIHFTCQVTSHLPQ